MTLFGSSEASLWVSTHSMLGRNHLGSRQLRSVCEPVQPEANEIGDEEE